MNEPIEFKIPGHKTTLMIHCLDTRPGQFAAMSADQIMAEVTRWHTLPKPQGRGWRAVAYAVIVDRQGNWAKGRDLDDDGDVLEETGAGAFGHNRDTIHIALEGGFGSRATDRFFDHFTEEQGVVLRWFIRKIREAAPHPIALKGHNEVANKACPGFNVREWYEGATGIPAVAPATTQDRPSSSAPDRPTLREGDRGSFVTDLQTQLHALGYAVGRIDGIFGKLVRSAVLAFQADNGLSRDGIVGPATWRALTGAAPRPERDVTEDDLRAAGSRTIKNGDMAQTATRVLAYGGSAVAAMGQADEVIAAIEDAQGVAERAMAVLSSGWPVLALIAGGLVILALIARMKSARVDDARTGRNLGR